MMEQTKAFAIMQLMPGLCHLWPEILKTFFDGIKAVMRSSLYILSGDVRKPDFCLCENKDADQLCSNCTADQGLCFRYTDSAISLLPTSEISSF